MRRILAWTDAVALPLGVGCQPDSGGGPPRRDSGTTDDAGVGPAAPDEDGDGCSDRWEGREDGTDSDGDGTPDYLDDDSDADGVADALECNTRVSGDEPADTDADGTHDFRDDDSDGNGIPDSTEGDTETDTDGDPDFRDTDNDGDTVDDEEEIGGDPAAPADYDGDGTPDYLDTDSDDDTIADLHESVVDTDRDDDDSDDDGWPDVDEAGDADESTPPADTDMDMVPDFRDPDSDNDGLSDAEEREHGTDRTSADTDGDGVTDLVEIAACDGDPSCEGDPLDGMSSPRTRGDFVFFEPYMMPPMPERDTLDFATDLHGRRHLQRPIEPVGRGQRDHRPGAERDHGRVVRGGRLRRLPRRWLRLRGLGRPRLLPPPGPDLRRRDGPDGGQRYVDPLRRGRGREPHPRAVGGLDRHGARREQRLDRRPVRRFHGLRGLPRERAGGMAVLPRRGGPDRGGDHGRLSAQRPGGLVCVQRCHDRRPRPDLHGSGRRAHRRAGLDLRKLRHVRCSPPRGRPLRLAAPQRLAYNPPRARPRPGARVP